MNIESKDQSDADLQKRAEEKSALILGLVFGGMIMAMIAGMMAFEMYAEKITESTTAPADAADR